MGWLRDALHAVTDEENGRVLVAEDDLREREKRIVEAHLRAYLLTRGLTDRRIEDVGRPEGDRRRRFA